MRISFAAEDPDRLIEQFEASAQVALHIYKDTAQREQPGPAAEHGRRQIVQPGGQGEMRADERLLSGMDGKLASEVMSFTFL